MSNKKSFIFSMVMVAISLSTQYRLNGNALTQNFTFKNKTILVGCSTQGLGIVGIIIAVHFFDKAKKLTTATDPLLIKQRNYYLKVAYSLLASGSFLIAGGTGMTLWALHKQPTGNNHIPLNITPPPSTIVEDEKQPTAIKTEKQRVSTKLSEVVAVNKIKRLLSTASTQKILAQLTTEEKSKLQHLFQILEKTSKDDSLAVHIQQSIKHYAQIIIAARQQES